ncbi:MAG: adenine deaminase [Rhodospirillales bacterium]|nr:adenine deaminase [Rhodospirillales bacterium]
MTAMAIPCPPAMRARLIAVAEERQAPDGLILGAQVWNAFTGEIAPGDIALVGDRIAKVGPWTGPRDEATEIIEAADRIAMPGYIEPHTHPWPFVNPLSLGEAALCRGTTALVYDDLQLHLAMGTERQAAITAALSAAALPHVYWVARIASQSRFQAEEDLFSAAAIRRLLEEPHIVGTGEMVRWTDLLDPARSARLLDILEMARRMGKLNDGHTAGASKRRLAALATAGIHCCHEAIDAEDALERLRQGFWVLLRHSSLRQDLPALLPFLKATHFHDRIALTTDGTSETHIERFGYTDHLLRLTLEAGVPAHTAYRLATLNPATLLGLADDLGAVAPGRIADINLLTDLATPRPERVICRGRLVAEQGRLVVPAPSATFPWKATYAGSAPVFPAWPAETFLLPADAPNPFPAAKLVNAAITRETPAPLLARDGGLWPAEQDALVLAVTDRLGGWLTQGVVQNMAPGLEAIATTYSTNGGTLVLGRSPAAMAEALARLARLDGGFAMKAVGGDWADFPLPMAGIHREGGFESAAPAAEAFRQAFERCGYSHSDPRYSLLFLTCDMLPELRAVEAGWLRVKTETILLPSRRMEGNAP